MTDGLPADWRHAPPSTFRVAVYHESHSDGGTSSTIAAEFAQPSDATLFWAGVATGAGVLLLAMYLAESSRAA